MGNELTTKNITLMTHIGMGYTGADIDTMIMVTDIMTHTDMTATGIDMETTAMSITVDVLLGLSAQDTGSEIKEPISSASSGESSERSSAT